MAKPSEEQIKCDHEWKGTQGLFKTYYDCTKCSVKKEDWDYYTKHPEKFDQNEVFPLDPNTKLTDQQIEDATLLAESKPLPNDLQELLEEFEEMINTHRF